MGTSSMNPGVLLTTEVLPHWAFQKGRAAHLQAVVSTVCWVSPGHFVVLCYLSLLQRSSSW